MKRYPTTGTRPGESEERLRRVCVCVCIFASLSAENSGNDPLKSGLLLCAKPLAYRS